MTEQEFRSAIVAEAETWKDTPYRASGRIKGVGVNCAWFLYSVAFNARVIDPLTPSPKWYTPQFATHSREERLIEYVLAYGAREVTENQLKPGDIVLYKSGLSHGHAALVIDWPTIMHVMLAHGCHKGNAREGVLGRYSMRFFTLWPGGAS